MEPPTAEELKLREARVRGAEQAIRALKEATSALEGRAGRFDADMRRVEDRQIGNLKWTIGAILGFGGILAAVGIVLLFAQADARRGLDERITTEVAAIRQQTQAIERDLAALVQQMQATAGEAAQGRQTADALSGKIEDLQQRLDDAIQRNDRLMGRLSADVDNIRADFAYLVEGGGHRSSFQGQVYIAVPYESADVDPTGTFLSDIHVSMLSSGGQIRAGTLRITVPRHGRIPRQAVVYSLNMQFLTALADLVDGAEPTALLGVASVDSLLSRFYQFDVWPVLAEAAVSNQLTEFVIETEPIAAD